ncbi:hypothetical protein BBO99_00000929 [Phytophthora kernoviae]|uniref:Uncharacterized protein n=2 Tax=Phytophthora kernoviae TaxID=325452 RepID=A0A3R7K3I7_9STRA|nr:hypothetical protein G195_002415 [Phytophthora kernoviae 00238/432]KAG2531700.1 hypothetical protein JM16_000742 [Phytophthora kernoviae]KAG2533015.1 hypothetical protein JM18_000824 [Phytophthora kernoviae]RLN37686.1 hypothetical protein BBI17_000831 [Phytophthora kernoviae]RLN84960.1 hypothetical protein BBO99_00000929 [Phytophthora kernoviae]
MATVSSTAAASIAIPNDVNAFAANVSPRGVDLEERLELSLDALIKERKKENKQLKKEEVKKLKQKPQTDKRKPIQQQRKQKQKQKQQAADVKTKQATKRKALMNKNRGLQVAPAATKGKTQQQPKTKTSIAATTAKLRRQMRADKLTQSSRHLVVGPKVVKQNDAGKQARKKNLPQQPRKVVSPIRIVQQNRANQPQQQTKSAKTPGRQVTHFNNKKTKLSITIAGSGSKKSQKKQQKTANKVFLPGKVSQAFGKQTSAAKKTVKRSKSRKLTAGSTTHVRQASQRKKN